MYCIKDKDFRFLFFNIQNQNSIYLFLSSLLSIYFCFLDFSSKKEKKKRRKKEFFSRFSWLVDLEYIFVYILQFSV